MNALAVCKNAVYAKTSKRYPILVYATFIIFVANNLLANYRAASDNDIFFLIALGRNFFSHGISYTNTMNITPNMPAIEHQWLWNAILYIFYKPLGWFGIAVLIVIACIIATKTIKLLCRTCRMTFEGMCVILALFFVLENGMVSYRPQSASIILLLLQLVVFESYRRYENKIQLLAMIPIMVLEANLHGAYLFVHFLFWAAYAVQALVPEKYRLESYYKIKDYFIVCILMLLASLLNPYGYHMLLYPFRSIGGVTSEYILEMQSPAMNKVGCLILLLSISAVAIIVANRHMYYCTTHIILFAGTIIMACMASKCWVFVPMSFIILIMPYVNEIPNLNRFIKPLAFPMPKKSLYLYRVILVLCSVYFALALISASVKPVNKKYMPVKAADYIIQKNHKANVFSESLAGSYLEFRGMKSYMDSRFELYTERFNGVEERLGNYCKAMSEYDIELANQILDSQEFDYAIVYNDIFLIALQARNDYKPVLQDGKCYLYKNTGA